MHAIRKFWSLSRREKKCFLEALSFLAVASVSIKVVAFRHIERFLRSRTGNLQHDLSLEQEVRLVQASILRATRALPWSALCLSQSIAEYLMLRRRGIAAAIIAGVQFAGDRSLNAHAWVDLGLSNHKKKDEASESYTVVMRIGSETADR